MKHEEWKAQVEKEAARYSDPEAEWEAEVSRLVEARRLTAQVLQEQLKSFFGNYSFEVAIDLSIGLYNWMIDVRTQECISILRGGEHAREAIPGSSPTTRRKSSSSANGSGNWRKPAMIDAL